MICIELTEALNTNPDKYQIIYQSKNTTFYINTSGTTNKVLPMYCLPPKKQ